MILSVEANIRSNDPNRNYPGGDILYSKAYQYDNFSKWSNSVIILPYFSESRGNISKMTANKLIEVNF